MPRPKKPKPSRAISRYFGDLARRAAAKMKGTEAARARALKAWETRRAKKAAQAEK